MRKQFRHLSSLEEAMDVLESLAIEPAATTVALAQAGGHSLAESIQAPIDVPGFDRSIMDGYAVKSADTVGAYDDDPVELHVAGEVVPGEAPSVTVDSGEAVEIATGAVIPEGATAVVKVEDTTRRDEVVSIYRPAAPQEHIMTRGADIAAGETVLRSGTRLDSRRVGLLAALGIETVPVWRRPTVGIISTGGEIVRPDATDRLAAGEIFDINSFSMSTAIEAAGGVPTIYPHAEDEYDAIRSSIGRAAEETDLVLSSGSTSASAEDVVYRVVEEVGDLLLHGIAVKPGKPTVFGRIDDTPVLGMPGNPISALMNFRLFVRPLLRWARDEREPATDTRTATIGRDMDSVGGRTQLAPVGLIEDPDRELVAYPVDKGSGAITSLADADGYVTIPADEHYVAAGEPASVTTLDAATDPPALLLTGDPCPVIDTALDEVAASVRWLDQGATDGMRLLVDGIADVAAVGCAPASLSGFDLDGVTRLSGYERRVGLLATEARSLAEVETVATLPRGTALYRQLDAMLDEADLDVQLRTRPSPAGLVRAVEDGAVDAAFTLEASAHPEALTVAPLTWLPMELYVATNRREKPAMEAFLSRLETALADAPDGIRSDDPIGTELALP